MEGNYFEKSELERLHFDLIMKQLNNKYDCKVYYSYSEGKDVWDAKLYIFEKETPKLKQRVLIEIKIRDRSYDTFLLEKVKLQNLFKYKNKWDKIVREDCGESDECLIWYVSVCPEGTYIFTLKEPTEYDWLNEDHWASTLNKSKGKINKIVTYLDKDSSKRVDVITNDSRLEKKTKMIEQKQTDRIYYDIFGEPYYKKDI